MQVRHFAESNFGKLDEIARFFEGHCQLELFQLFEMREHGDLTKRYFCLEFKLLKLRQGLHQVKQDQVLQVPRTEHGLLGGCVFDTYDLEVSLLKIGVKAIK